MWVLLCHSRAMNYVVIGAKLRFSLRGFGYALFIVKGYGMKKKKILVGLLSTACVALTGFAFASCGGNGSDNVEKEPTQLEQVYAQYVVYAQAEGETPIPYEEWVVMIKDETGETGRDIAKVEIIDGYLWITYTDSETPVNVGKVTADGAVDEVQGTDGLEYYLLSDGTYAVAQGSTMYLEEIVIPATYKGKAVTAIKQRAFENSKAISITIPDGVTSIGYYSFRDCSNLTSVVIPNSVTSIGKYTFYDCSSLTSIEIPDSVTSIGSSAFSGCSGLMSVIIPNSVTSIDMGAFYECSSLTSVVIPDSVTSIGSSAFEHCSSLTSVVIPDSVTSIGNYVFRGCGRLTSVVIGNSVTSIGCYSFCDCTSLTNVVIPDSVTSIGDWAFYDCRSLTSIEIPDSVTSIDMGAFYSCSSLMSIEIPNSVTSIGSSAFSSCSGLTSVVIPDSVTSIGKYAFRDCSSLHNVYIEDLTAWCNISFGNELANPLYYVKNLYLNGETMTNLVIPNGVTSIGDYAFSYCNSLTSVVIPDSVTSIGDSAFYYCSSLTSLVMPDNVTSIGDWAFSDCSKLTSVYYEGPGRKWAKISFGSHNGSLTNATVYYYSATRPIATGNYWHYDENGDVVIW